MKPGVSTEAELKRHCRWKIEDADLKRDIGRIDDTERDRLVAQAWADLQRELEKREARDGDA